MNLGLKPGSRVGTAGKAASLVRWEEGFVTRDRRRAPPNRPNDWRTDRGVKSDRNSRTTFPDPWDGRLVESGATTIEVAPRLEIVRRYGDFTMAYATLQSNMKYFDTHGGYVAYDTSVGIPFVLGDPVGPAACHAVMLSDFLRQYPGACFCQVSRPVAEILAQLGRHVNEFGSDMELRLPTYTFDGPKKSKFRQAASKIEREGFTIEELTAAELNRQSIDDLNSSWRNGKTIRHEARFLVRPFVFDDEPDVRKFYLLDPQREIVAMVNFDPIWRDGEVVGYSPAVKRRSPAAPTGAEVAVTKFAIERFRGEGKLILRLGLMPFHQVERSGFAERAPLRILFQTLYRHGDRWIYSFRGHADFKHRYRGELQKVYYASPRKWLGLDLVALMRVCRMI